MKAQTLQEAMTTGRGIERPFRCEVHDDTNASASVNTVTGLWCLAPDTKVLTADLRHVRIDSVRVGDALVGFDEMPVQMAKGKKRNWRRALVTNTSIIERECYEIEMSDGTVVVSSADHQWLCQTSHAGMQWRATPDLRTRNGSFVNLLRLTDVWDTDTSWHAGYLAGAFDGEGTYMARKEYDTQIARRVSARYYQSDNEMLAQTSASLDAVGITYSRYVHNHSQRTKREHYKDMHQLVVQSKAEVMKFLGTVRPARLLPKFCPSELGGIKPIDRPQVVRLTPVGVRKVVALETSTGTFVAEGLASHNCCYACGAAGKVDESMTIPDAETLLTYLKGDAQPRIYSESWLDLFDADHASRYWAKRFGETTADHFRCGTHPVTGQPTYPIRDALGHVLGVVVRQDTQPKYKYPYGVSTSRTFFGDRKPNPIVVLVEGAADVMALHQSGIPYGWTVLGCYGAGIHAPQVQLIADLSPRIVVCAFDNDAAGHAAADRTKSQLSDIAEVLTHTWKDFNDPGDMPADLRIASIENTLAKEA